MARGESSTERLRGVGVPGVRSDAISSSFKRLTAAVPLFPPFPQPLPLFLGQLFQVTLHNVFISMSMVRTKGSRIGIF